MKSTKVDYGCESVNEAYFQKLCPLSICFYIYDLLYDVIIISDYKSVDFRGN